MFLALTVVILGAGWLFWFAGNYPVAGICWMLALVVTILYALIKRG